MTKETKEEEEEGKNVISVKQLYNAFRRRDISSILDMFTDCAVIHGPAPAGVLPGGVFTMVVKELQNSSWLLANPLKCNSLSCGIL